MSSSRPCTSTGGTYTVAWVGDPAGAGAADDVVVGQVALDSGRGRLLITTVVLGSAVAMLTATVVNVALPTLARDLDAGSSGQKWIINGYTLTLAALILIGGSLGDRFGRVRVYRVGVVWFAVASLLCALAWDTSSLIVFRLLQGVGGALLTPGSLAIIQATLRHEDRGRGVGAWSGISGIAAAVGPLLGGLLVEVSWRWVFVVNVPVALAVLVLSRWVPESHDPSADDTRLDVAGAWLTTVVLGASSFALIEGPEGDFSWLEIACAVTAIAGVAAIVVVERGRDHAMLPIELFADRTFAVANAVTFAIYGGMGVLFFLLSIQLQVSAGWSPLEAGTSLLPVTALMLLLSSRAGGLASKIGPRWPLTIGAFTVAGGMLLMTRIGRDASFFGDVLPAVTVFGLGLAAIVAPVTSTALDAAPDDRSGAASGVNNAVARTAGL
ncbi:MAG: MFS transporter, partial [Ilumatobacter sp.]|nr:MFS transporter [Ilumatobacter sp.]